MSSSPQDLTLSNVPQTLTLGNVPQNLTLSNVPQTLTLNNVPQQPQGGLSAVEPQPEIVVMPRYANPQNEMPVMPRPEMNWDIIFPEIPAYDVSAAYRASAEASRQAKIAAAKQAYATNPDAFLASMQKPAAPTPMPQPVMPQPVTPQYDMPVMPTPMPQYDMPVMPTPMPVMPEPTPMPVPMDNSITNWNPAVRPPTKKPTIADMLARANLGSAATAPQSQNLTLSNVPQDLTLSNVPQTLTLGNVPQQQGGLLGSLVNKYY